MKSRFNGGKRLAAGTLALFAAAAAFFSASLIAACDDGGVQSVYRVASSEDKGNSADQAEESVAGLVIPLSDFSSTAKFYGVFLEDGAYLEVIAVKYGDSYRTAFNTCQVCYGSPKAYFKQSGTKLVCQNCKNSFSVAQVGVSGGGCAPYPITESERVQTEDAVIIPDSLLRERESLFQNWGGGG